MIRLWFLSPYQLQIHPVHIRWSEVQNCRNLHCKMEAKYEQESHGNPWRASSCESKITVTSKGSPVSAMSTSNLHFRTAPSTAARISSETTKYVCCTKKVTTESARTAMYCHFLILLQSTKCVVPCSSSKPLILNIVIMIIINYHHDNYGWWLSGVLKKISTAMRRR